MEYFGVQKDNEVEAAIVASAGGERSEAVLVLIDLEDFEDVRARGERIGDALLKAAGGRLGSLRSRVLRVAVAVALFPAVAVVAPASAEACTFGAAIGEALAPAADAPLEQTADGVPLRVVYPGDATNRTAQFAVARLNRDTPKLGTELPADVGTVVERGELTHDAASKTWNAVANASGWAKTPGEYVWQSTLRTHIPASPPPTPDANGTVVWNSCSSLVARTLVSDGIWAHRISVLGTPAVRARAAKARDGRASVTGTIDKAFPGKVRLSVACPGARARTTFVATKDGRWSRRVNAERGCRVVASVSARKGWAASEASLRVR